MPLWLSKVARYLPSRELPSEDALRELWASIGAEPAVIDEICSLRMAWFGGFLNIVETTDGAAADDNPIHRLSIVIMSLWSFSTFSDSRWISVGTSSRCLVRGWLSGIDDIVQVILADPAQSVYNIAGYRKLVPELRGMLVVCALGSWPSDSCLRSVLEDGRLAHRRGEVQDAVRSEIDFLLALGEHTWMSLGATCDMAGAHYRHEVLQASHVTVAFLDRRVFSKVRASPWHLCDGDIPTRLAELLAAPEPPEEPIVAKLFVLLNSGMITEDVAVNTLQLMYEVRWDIDRRAAARQRVGDSQVPPAHLGARLAL